jgi:hypothetical protein
MKAIKITNPLYVGELAPLIQKFFERITETTSLKGISYETIYTYLTNVVQFGDDKAELWVSLLDKEPVAFAVWRLMVVPHYGKVTCDYIYKRIKEREPFILLVDEFIKFSERHKAPYIQVEAVNEPQAKLFTKVLKHRGFKADRTTFVTLIGRKENGK